MKLYYLLMYWFCSAMTDFALAEAMSQIDGHGFTRHWPSYQKWSHRRMYYAGRLEEA